MENHTLENPLDGMEELKKSLKDIIAETLDAVDTIEKTLYKKRTRRATKKLKK